MIAVQEGWAEQNPADWWEAVCRTTQEIIATSGIRPKEIKSIGIAYQMHGLVVVDKSNEVLRPAIIWCDSRAVGIGNQALGDLGREYCYGHLLNSPGNFTASKLRWIKENEPQLFERIHKIMLPGDYVAMKLTGEIFTTISGLSEGIMWDFKSDKLADKLLDHYGIPQHYIAELVDTFAMQGKVNSKAAAATGLPAGIPVTYRAGDQPNNALSLQVLHPGDVAATGGTSGVVYGVSECVAFDPKSRVNGFAHVNHTKEKTRIGQLLCINGAGSQYAWIRKAIASAGLSYQEMESKLTNVPIGCDGLVVLPFGNGAERMLENRMLGAQMSNVQFNIHTREHFYRAALEGIAFAFVYGVKLMEGLGIKPQTMRVGNDNLFQSEVFASTIANLLDCQIKMMDTTGAIGAAQASGVAVGFHSSVEDAVASTQAVKSYQPSEQTANHEAAYHKWLSTLEELIKRK